MSAGLPVWIAWDEAPGYQAETKAPASWWLPSVPSCSEDKARHLLLPAVVQRQCINDDSPKSLGRTFVYDLLSCTSYSMDRAKRHSLLHTLIHVWIRIDTHTLLQGSPSHASFASCNTMMCVYHSIPLKSFCCCSSCLVTHSFIFKKTKVFWELCFSFTLKF